MSRPYERREPPLASGVGYTNTGEMQDRLVAAAEAFARHDPPPNLPDLLIAAAKLLAETEEKLDSMWQAYRWIE